MLTLPEFLELIDHRITGGGEYQWQCYGDHAQTIDSDAVNHSLSVIFDRQDQTVYEVTVCDYPNNRAYRIINPDYKAKHDAEASVRGVQPRQAWDNVNYVDLDVVDDFIQKGLAIRAGDAYDTRVQVELDLDDDLLLQLMTQAHKQDITLNKMVEQILTEMIDRTQKLQTES